ncbi:hypothetical protein ABN097_06320 [Enterobacter cloacae]|uniref:hypothetical protein n=1 Tax=Enterobacter cloacae TaxID=550 RepID=UPI0032DA4E22
MKIFTEPFLTAVYDHVVMFRMSREFAAMLWFIRLAFRLFISRPLAILSYLFLAVLIAIPVTVFIKPAFTLDNISEGILRVFSLFPELFYLVFVAGVLSEAADLLQVKSGRGRI